MSSSHAGSGPAQRRQTWPQPSMNTDSATVVSAQQEGFAQVIIAEVEVVVASMSCFLSLVFPVAGSWLWCVPAPEGTQA